MNEKENKTSKVNSNSEQTVKSASILRGLIDGSLLTRNWVQKQLPFILFMAFLGLVYISNRYHADKVRREMKRIKSELGEIKAKAIYTTSELMKLGQQTEVVEYVKKYGLEIRESEVPPKKIVVNRIPGD
jgi:hypothetical protein